jgi:hypothetical protein
MAHQALSKKTIADFPVWKTITLGHYKSTAAYRRAFTKAKIILGEWADDILGQDPDVCARGDAGSGRWWLGRRGQ